MRPWKDFVRPARLIVAADVPHALNFGLVGCDVASAHR